MYLLDDTLIWAVEWNMIIIIIVKENNFNRVYLREINLMLIKIKYYSDTMILPLQLDSKS